MPEKILVSDSISEDGLRTLAEAGLQVDSRPDVDPKAIGDIISDYVAWIIRSRSSATADIIAKAHNLRVIGRAGVGVDNVDVPAATRRGIVVMNTPGGNTTSTAEHTIAMLLSLSRGIPAADASMRAGKWDRKSFMGTEIFGKTLGVLGLGRIGQEVVKRMKAFGMHIVGFDPFVPQERIRELGVEPAEVDEICRRADFITVHTPLSPETKGLINAERLGMMKKSAYVINCARGGIVDEAALAEALRAKKIAGAALDVFAEEPLPKESELRTLTNCIVTPHIAASTHEAQDNVAVEIAEQVVEFLRRGVIRNAVNAPNLDAETLEKLRPYLTLAEKLGAFIAQHVGGPVVELDIRYSGTLIDIPQSPLTTAAVRGFLQQTTDEPVNYVNAIKMLVDRGAKVLATKANEATSFSNLITIEARTESGATHKVAGTLYSPQRARIVMVDDKSFDAVPNGYVVVIENRDVPGIIGSVGTVFGRHGINIAQMTWGRTEHGTTAMTVINVDTKVGRDVLSEIRAQPNIVSARVIDLN
jgi:D-3-phosphoglycerate dehydrogenase